MWKEEGGQQGNRGKVSKTKKRTCRCALFTPALCPCHSPNGMAGYLQNVYNHTVATSLRSLLVLLCIATRSFVSFIPLPCFHPLHSPKKRRNKRVTEYSVSALVKIKNIQTIYNSAAPPEELHVGHC
eukprot:gb/GEZN01015299.1/.p1 GENE.gb/GEZN01015299.1/~~gb/GEZN01015299.1/.p1  ORF type:complete len:127 (+),score=5.67 gb/GEZN01015299.1/:123-503(+)